MKRKIFFVGSLIVGALSVSTLVAAGIVTTKHNLSVSGPGDVRASSESQVCIFCHVSHRASPVAPLWNRRDSGQSYVPYTSSTAQASPGQPTGASILCLSCHDGTVALGEVLSRDTPIAMAGGMQRMPPGRSNLGTDLSDDHPISFHYSSDLVQRNAELLPPGILDDRVKLDATGQMQCTACHDPHKDTNGKFLAVTHHRGQLCLVCHDKRLQSSSHGTSPNTWDGVGVDPWPETDWDSVDANACNNCHITHSAGGPRLMKYGAEEDNCLVCHNGHVADTNIELVLNKTYVHPVRDTVRIHDPIEDAVVRERHVECEDCHDPHVGNLAQGRQVAESLGRARGVTITGAEVPWVNHEYEICLRCHGDSPGQAPPSTYRLDPETNLRRKLSPGNPSYHPVAAPGRNPVVPSLIAPLTPVSVIKCSDCHNNDDTSGPRGPHGSNYRSLLERQYVTLDPNPESADSYALCYKCHDRNSILSNESFPLHSAHIGGGGFVGGVPGATAGGGQNQNAPCNVCHDPHGVRAVGRHSGEKLMNFDIDAVEPNQAGQLYFESRGYRSGSCSLRCHGKEHFDCAYDSTTLHNVNNSCRNGN